MADITMCLNEKCKMKNGCYRFTAKADELCQAYAMFICGEENDYIDMIDEC